MGKQLSAKCIYLGKRADKARKGEKPWEHFAWDVTLTYGEQHLSTPYKCGMGHVEGYREGSGRVRTEAQLRAAKLDPHTVAGANARANPVPRAPSAFDVLNSLVSDATCWNCARGFEEFCADLGYDEDSRTAERVYNACAETYKQLRSLLGSDFESVLSMDEDALQAWCDERAQEVSQ